MKTSRRSQPGYVPRPPNCFIIFRNDFVRGKKYLRPGETTAFQNEFKQLAQQEKTEHSQLYPGYQFNPERKKKKEKKKTRADPSTPSVPQPEQLGQSDVERSVIQGAVSGVELTLNLNGGGSFGAEFIGACIQLTMHRHGHGHDYPSAVNTGNYYGADTPTAIQDHELDVRHLLAL